MDFGDDDDDWDANELEALEVAAVNTYAATQQQRTQGQPESRRQGIQESTPPDSLARTDVDALFRDKQKYEKLTRDKQGELLILKSNIARTNAEHTNALESLKQASKSVKDELTAQLEAYKDKVARLETDLTFQRQELKEVKSKGAVLGRSDQSPHNGHAINPTPKGFPTKVAFERDESSTSRHYGRKRKRVSHASTDDAAMDDFDLAEQHSQEVPTREKSVDAVVQTNTLQTVSAGRLVPNDTVQSDPNMFHEEDMIEQVESRELGNQEVALDHATVCSELLSASDSDGNNCIAYLSSKSDELESSVEGQTFSMGQALISLLTVSHQHTTAEIITLDVAKRLSLWLTTRKADYDVGMRIFPLLRSALSFAPMVVSSWLIRYQSSEASTTPLAVIQEIISTPHPFSFRSSALSMILTLVISIRRDQELGHLLQSQLRPTIYKSLLSSKVEPDLCIMILHILAFLSTGGWNQYNPELLDHISYNLEKDQYTTADLLAVRKTIAQCLYCLTLSPSGLEQVRQSRHVIPRLVRRISRELDALYESASPRESRELIKILVKLYYILLKDESSAVSEMHWRSLEIRSAHLTSMTRIVYAEDHNAFDNATQDWAMDLLELAVSPEEGNDIWEIMGGIDATQIENV